MFSALDTSISALKVPWLPTYLGRYKVIPGTHLPAHLAPYLTHNVHVPTQTCWRKGQCFRSGDCSGPYLGSDITFTPVLWNFTHPGHVVCTQAVRREKPV
jgi:hypothetical protein